MKACLNNIGIISLLAKLGLARHVGRELARGGRAATCQKVRLSPASARPISEIAFSRLSSMRASTASISKGSGADDTPVRAPLLGKVAPDRVRVNWNVDAKTTLTSRPASRTISSGVAYEDCGIYKQVAAAMPLHPRGH